MIIYHKRWWGFLLLSRFYGSALPRALPFACFSSLLAFLLKTYLHDELRDAWEHPYPANAFSTVVGWILVFRVNQSYNRYMTGRSEVQMLSSRLADFASTMLAFDDITNQGSDTNASLFRRHLVHLVSLLHAMALQQLRVESSLDNIVVHDSDSPLRPGDAAHVDDFKPERRMFSMFFLQTGSRRAAAHYLASPISVIGGLSPGEQAALTMVDEGDGGGRGGWGPPLNGDGVWACGERPALVCKWLHLHVFRRRSEIGMNVDGPVLSRGLQMISDAMGAYMRARAIADTPYPFPHSQMCTTVLLLFSCVVPVVTASWIDAGWLAILTTFATTLTYWALNEVARELEDPFVYDPNEIPLPRLQHALNSRLLIVLDGALDPGRDINGLETDKQSFKENLLEVAEATLGGGSSDGDDGGPGGNAAGAGGRKATGSAGAENGGGGMLSPWLPLGGWRPGKNTSEADSVSPGAAGGGPSTPPRAKHLFDVATQSEPATTDVSTQADRLVESFEVAGEDVAWDPPDGLQ